jgi:hypothetical protein
VKLNPQKAREIRNRHLAGEKLELLAKEFGISVGAAEDVVTYRTWAFAGPKSPTDGENAGGRKLRG